mgnify:CR=1 FL=1
MSTKLMWDKERLKQMSLKNKISDFKVEEVEKLSSTKLLKKFLLVKLIDLIVIRERVWLERVLKEVRVPSNQLSNIQVGGQEELLEEQWLELIML